MTGRDRIGWLVLLAGAMTFGVLEMRPPPPGSPPPGPLSPGIVPLERLSIRITVAADGAMRVEAPDGTYVAFPSPPLDEPTKADEILFRLRDELTRLDPQADPDRLFEIDADPGTSFQRLLWIFPCTYPLHVLPTRRRYALSRLGDRSVVVWFTDVTPARFQDPTPVPTAEVRLFSRAGAGSGAASVGALAAVGTGYGDGGAPPEDGPAEGSWSPIEPKRKAVRDWLRRLRQRPGDWHGVLHFGRSEHRVPYGFVFEVMRGFDDAGLPFDFAIDATR